MVLNASSNLTGGELTAQADSNNTTNISIILQYFNANVVALTFFGTIIVFVNSLVILSFLKESKLRKRTANLLICSQSCIDLITGVVYIPVCLVETYYNQRTWTSFLACYILFLSMFNLFALSGDRFLALTKPLSRYKKSRITSPISLVPFIWLTPLCLTLIPLLWWFAPIKKFLFAQRIYLGVTWSFMFILCTLMTLLYVFVTSKARKSIRRKRLSIAIKSHEKSVRLAKKELRVVHLFGLLLFFFVAAYLPIIYMNLCDIVGAIEYIPGALELIGLYSFILNSVVNPILCIYLKKDYLLVICNILQIKMTRFQHKFSTTILSRSPSYNASRKLIKTSSKKCSSKKCSSNGNYPLKKQSINVNV